MFITKKEDATHKVWLYFVNELFTKSKLEENTP